MKKVFEQSLVSAIAWLLVWPAMADELLSAEAAKSMRSLDDQVQQIKSDVLDIATELNLLEEELLFPSNTQLAVFIALEPENTMRLDAVELSVNGQPATHYIYSFKELEALQQGGVQRLYTGNLPRGAHSLDIHLVGKSPEGRDFSTNHSFTFEKGIEPSLLGLTVHGSNGNRVEIADW